MSTHTWVQGAGAQAMWDSWQAAHRPNVELAFRLLPKVESVYEVGCGSGPNLRLLREKFPHMRLGGSEPHDALREFAAEHLGLAIDSDELPHTPSGWDVLLTCFTMAYVTAEKAAETFQRAQHRYAVILEPGAYMVPFAHPAMYRREKKLPLYAHDYPNILKNAGWYIIWRWPIVPHHQGLNHLIVAERA